MNTRLMLGPPVQIAYAVRNIEAAVAEWSSTRGAGPFFVRRHIPVSDVIVNGKPGNFDHTSAYGQMGPIMVELVLDHTAGPSPVTALLGEARTGLHHMAHFVDDCAATRAALTAHGWPELFQAGTGGGGKFYFHDARAALGHLIELYEPADGVRKFYEMVAAAAQGWDGRDALREMG